MKNMVFHYATVVLCINMNILPSYLMSRGSDRHVLRCIKRILNWSMVPKKINKNKCIENKIILLFSTRYHQARRRVHTKSIHTARHWFCRKNVLSQSRRTYCDWISVHVRRSTWWYKVISCCQWMLRKVGRGVQSYYERMFIRVKQSKSLR